LNSLMVWVWHQNACLFHGKLLFHMSTCSVNKCWWVFITFWAFF
jgi:hypothetical protein